MWWTEDGKEQLMVEHTGGLTFADMCAIENFIENITHNKHDTAKFHNELVRLKTLWESMVSTENDKENGQIRQTYEISDTQRNRKGL